MAIVRLGRSHHSVGQHGAILEPVQVIPRPILAVAIEANFKTVFGEREKMAVAKL